jgi:hypothetical protein
MANTTVIRTAGKTYYFPVTGTSSASTLIEDNTNDQVNYAAFLNTDVNPCLVRFANYSPCPAAVFPTSGAPSQEGFVLPPNMTRPIVLAVPPTPFYMTVVSPTASPTYLYVTPVANQT